MGDSGDGEEEGEAEPQETHRDVCSRRYGTFS